MRGGIGIGLLLLGVMAAPAWARPSEAAWLHFMRALPKSRWQPVPDSTEPGKLWAGRIGAFNTLVRTRSQAGELVFARVEVALPQDVSDEMALAIHARFVSEFVGYPDEVRATMTMLRSMRRTIMGTGRRDAQQVYRSNRLTLSLDGSSAEVGASGNSQNWGVLYWKVEVQPLMFRRP